METKEIERMYEGFFEVCDKTALTMGLEGGLAVIETYEGLTPTSTKDGVTTVKSFFYNDRCKNIGAFFAKQAAARTLVLVGDNTTTTLVFAADLVRNVQKFNSRVKKGMQIAKEDFEKQLKLLKKPTSGARLKAVASISANNDAKIGKLVYDAYKRVGKNGVVAVREDLNSSRTTLKVSEGFVFDKGWKTKEFINQQTKGTWEGEDVNIIVFEGNLNISSGQTVIDAIKGKEKEPLLIVCESLAEDLALNMVDFNTRGLTDVCVVESPFFLDQRKVFLKDLALYTETDSFVQGTSDFIKMGKASKVIVTQSSTSIIQNEVNPVISDKVKELKATLEFDPEKDFVQKRITAFEGVAVIINVGEASEGARKELFDRVEDSVAAVKAALEEGVIAGGGSGLVYISNSLSKKFDNEDIQKGYNSVKQALLSPLKTVLNNADVDYTKYLEFSENNYGVGYNLATNQVEDLVKEGVLDSVKGLRVAMENALSVASLILNTKVIIPRLTVE